LLDSLLQEREAEDGNKAGRLVWWRFLVKLGGGETFSSSEC